MSDNKSMTARRRDLSMAEGHELAQAAIAEHSGQLVMWSTALDNYDPPRRHAGNYAVRYTRKVSGTPGFKFWPSPSMTHADRALYLLDDGVTVTPYFVAGWQNLHDPDRWLVLEPVAAGVLPLASPHGPRMTYYLVVRAAPEPPITPRPSYAEVVCDSINGNLHNL